MTAALDGRPGIVKIQSHGECDPNSDMANTTDKLPESRRSLLGDGEETLDRNYTPYQGGRQPNPPTRAVTPRKRMIYIPNSLWTWSFLAISICQAVISLGLEGCVAEMH